MTAEAVHTDVGAYALGLLEPDDARAFEDHLATCGRCSAELAGFAAISDLLTGLGPVEDDPPSAPAAGAPDRMRRRDRARGPAGGDVPSIRLLVAAAAILLFTVGVTVGATGGGDDPVPADLRGWGEIRSAGNAKSGLEAVAAVQSKGWGTHVALDLGNLKGPLTCRLIAVSTKGEESEVTGWAVPARGYGALGSPDHLQVHGGIAIPRADLERLVVRADGVGDLLSIPT
ncbi:zf-HC2 domain-containing protein [Actinomadura soli]|uniref:Zf-HC2 domain-containing protein n=1 Tax=Actinomadura soli TaxID=2508997 RepID=A0A5C4JHC5_9ACTN|nr:zf-HC2 domain-containing protein [Actinomadura soli]TMR05509.1 zf-HC2 domain-containing protein [Actinomadura soli]